MRPRTQAVKLGTKLGANADDVIEQLPDPALNKPEQPESQQRNLLIAALTGKRPKGLRAPEFRRAATE